MEVAYTLYRVFTKKQVDKKKTISQCRKMLADSLPKEWAGTLAKSFCKKACRGLRFRHRTVMLIQDLKTAALKGKFQILLIFMFDRIGRIDYETPFVVE